jgi:hypothetical protein
MAVTPAMEGRRDVGECPHAGVSPLHPVPHQNGKRYKIEIKNALFGTFTLWNASLTIIDYGKFYHFS